MKHDEKDNRRGIIRSLQKSGALGPFIDKVEVELRGSMNHTHKLRTLAVARFLSLVSNGETSLDASYTVAQVVFGSSTVYRAKAIRKLSKVFIETGNVPVTRQGNHSKFSRLIDDEDVQFKCLDFLRKQKKGTVDPYMFEKWVNTVLVMEVGASKGISTKTSIRWLNDLGWGRTTLSQGVYFDGHERIDVVAADRVVFLEKVAKLQRLMAHFEGEKYDREILPVLQEGEKRHIWVVQDECIFNANNGQRFAYFKNGDQMLLKKGNGRSIHVSGFLTPEQGPLQHKGEHARVIIHPGKNGDSHCEICKPRKRARTMLLCDGCDRGFHTACVGLAGVPAGDWFCTACAGGHSLAPDGQVNEPVTRARESGRPARQRSEPGWMAGFSKSY